MSGTCGHRPVFVDMSTPASFGVEWTSGESGSRFQLVNPRGTAGLLFGVLVAGRDRWSITPVVDPSRFGMTEPPRTLAQFQGIAARFAE